MWLRWTAKAGERLAGKIVDRHRSEALGLVADGLAIIIDPAASVERQIVAEMIEKRRSAQNITVLHVTPEDLEGDDIDNNEKTEQ